MEPGVHIRYSYERDIIMTLRQLGNSDLNIARMGIGAWAIGGGKWEFGWGPQNDNDSIEAIHAGLDQGLNWRIGEAARQTVKAKFCGEKIVPRYEAYYEETLARTRHRPV